METIKGYVYRVDSRYGITTIFVNTGYSIVPVDMEERYAQDILDTEGPLEGRAVEYSDYMLYFTDNTDKE